MCRTRRGWDSNPCAPKDKRFSKPPRYDRFDTSPKEQMTRIELAFSDWRSEVLTFILHLQSRAPGYIRQNVLHNTVLLLSICKQTPTCNPRASDRIRTCISSAATQLLRDALSHRLSAIELRMQMCFWFALSELTNRPN